MKINYPPYPVYPLLFDNSILMQQIGAADIPQIIEISFYNGQQAENLEMAIAMQKQIDKDYLDENTIHWGIFEKKTGLIVGTCGYYRGFANNSGELGCILLPAFRGFRYMSAALRLAIQFGIKNMGLSEIKAITNQKNEPALILLHRLGFVKTNDLPDEDIEFVYIIN